MVTNEGAQDFRLPPLPMTELGGKRRNGREIIPHRPGVRIEDVDAFSNCS